MCSSTDTDTDLSALLKTNSNFRTVRNKDFSWFLTSAAAILNNVGFDYRRLKDFRSTLYVEIYKDFIFLMTPYFLNNMLLMADIPKCCHTTPKTLKNRHFSEMSY